MCQLPIPVITVKSPIAANGCYMINEVATQHPALVAFQPVPVATQQPAPVASQQPAPEATQQFDSTAEANGAVLGVVLKSEVSPDDQVKYCLKI